MGFPSFLAVLARNKASTTQSSGDQGGESVNLKMFSVSFVLQITGKEEATIGGEASVESSVVPGG